MKLHYIMNDIANKLLLAGDKFMPEIHLKQLGFSHSASGPFTKNKEGIQKLRETGDTKYIYRNELDEASFQHDRLMEILKIYQEEQLQITFYKTKHLIVLKIQNMTDIRKVLLQWL